MELIENYKQSLQAKGLRSIENFTTTTRDFLKYLQERNLDPLRLPVGFGDEYRSHLLHQQKPLSRGTINNKLNRIKGFYRHLAKKDQVLSNPFDDTQFLSLGRTVPKNILSIEQMGKLLNNFGLQKEHDRMLLVVCELLYGSALRISEVQNLLLKDVDFDTRTLTVIDAKTGKLRKAPMSEMSLRRLKEYLSNQNPTDYLFAQRGKTTLRCLLNRKLKRECERLELPIITSHGFRHSAATHMLKKGAGIRQVQAFLGHERIKTTQIYTRIITEDLKNLVKGFHPREKESC